MTIRRRNGSGVIVANSPESGTPGEVSAVGSRPTTVRLGIWGGTKDVPTIPDWNQYLLSTGNRTAVTGQTPAQALNRGEIRF